MRVLIVGAGIVGRAASWDMARRGHGVIIADRDRAAAYGVANELDLQPLVLDVADASSVERALEDVDAIIAAVPGAYGVEVASAAIDAGCHYFDFGGNATIVERELTLHEAALEAGVAVIPDGGLAPGLVNVLATDLMRRLGDGPIQELRMRVGALPQEPVGALGYDLAFSADGLLTEYSEPAEILRQRRRTVAEPLTDVEEHEWPGLPPLEAFHTSGGSSTMCDLWESRVHELDYKTFRYRGHATSFAVMRELGLFGREAWIIDGEAVVPRDVVREALRRLQPADADVVILRCWARAVRNGAHQVTGVQLEDRPDERFTALARTTAFPVTAAVDLIARGRLDVSGALAFHEALTGDELLPELAEVGIAPAPWVPGA